MDLLTKLILLVSPTYIDERGYKRFRSNDNLVHRWVAKRKLGRKLRSGEVVHHIDRDKLNNDFRNLWVFKNQAEHDRAHKIDAIRHGEKVSYKGFKKQRF